jgi:hypothetical protein
VIAEKGITGMKSSVYAKKTENFPAPEIITNGDFPAIVVAMRDTPTTKPLVSANQVLFKNKFNF